MEYDSLNIYQLRAELRRLRKFNETKPICVMKRSEILAQVKIYKQLMEMYNEMEKKAHLKPEPRIIPIANEVVEGCEMKIPEIPKERVVPDRLKKKQSTIIREDKDGREE